MADPMTPPAMSARAALVYALLLVASLAGGYFYLKQPRTEPVLTAGYAVRPEATRFHCFPSLTRIAAEEGAVEGTWRTWLGGARTDIYLVVEGNEVKVGTTMEEAESRQATRWQVDKNEAGQLVIYAKDPANPVVDKAATLVLDKTNGVGLFKNTLNRQFQYLSCQEVAE